MPTHQPITAVTFECSVCKQSVTEMRIRHRAKRSTCKPCRSGNRKRYYWKNPDLSRAKTKQWRKDNPEKAAVVAEKIKMYHEAHREELVQYRHDYFLANREKYKERRAENYRENRADYIRKAREWKDANPERAKATSDAWRIANPDKIRANTERRRSRYVGSFTDSDIAVLRKRQKGKCGNPSCDKNLKDGFHIDHILPVSKGGTCWPENLQLLCPKCNIKKSAKDPYEWAQANGALFV